ncbi:HD domain-containing protein [Candidatus Bathyarchaeota archaeon]|nr:HD domain-containing protein [Candidatus Bathyarchaeota archaeon]
MGKYEDKALELASERHRGQLDDQGRPYFFAHIVQVHNILKTVTDDEVTICAGILHDIIEDTDTTYEELLHEFNKEIADLVLEVTYEETEKGEQYFPYLKTRKAVIIKFADRLSNLSRMDDWPGDWQMNYLNKSKFWNTQPPK